MTTRTGKSKSPSHSLASLVIAGVLVYITAVVSLYAAQRSFVFQPGGSTSPATWQALGWQQRPLDLGGGLAATAWWKPPTRPGTPSAVIFHGNAGQAADRADRAVAMLRAGWGVMLVEYPGYGGTPGTPTETSLTATGKAALQDLKSLGISPRQTVVYGESLGTGVATIAVAGQPCGALVLESPFTSLADVASASLPWAPVHWLMVDQFNSAAAIHDVRCPVLVMQGDLDQVVPPPLGHALYELAPQPKEFWVAHGADHTNLVQFGAMTKAIDFVEAATMARPIDPAMTTKD